MGKEIGSSLKGGGLLAFSGGLGAGKTTFIQGLAEGLNIKSKIVSPTFILMREYSGAKLHLYHLDLYRLEGNIEKEVRNLGLFDIWGNPKNIVAIEWAEKLEIEWPKNTTWVKIEELDEGIRKINYETIS